MRKPKLFYITFYDLRFTNLDFRFTIFIILTALIFNSSCKKEKKTETIAKTAYVPYYQPALDNAEAEIFCNDMFEITSAAITYSRADTTLFKNRYCIKLPKSTIDIITGDSMKILNFGSVNTTCSQRAHRGVLIVKYKGNYYTQGFTASIIPDSLNHFYTDNCLIEGRILVTDTENLAKSRQRIKHQKSTKTINYSWEVNGQNFKITHSDGKTHYWNSARLYQIDQTDTIAYITSASPTTGTDINGIVYTTTIDLSLEKKISCKYIDAGNIVFIVSGLYPFYINYGNGICDNAAIVTVEVAANPDTYQRFNITLP